jgi:predicted acylesterase/phospholipase RssA
MMHQYLYDNAPLVNLLNLILTNYDSYKRRFAMGALDVNTGEYHIFDQQNTKFGAETVRAAIASSSIPFIFKPEIWENRVLVDGGTVWNINIPSAVE